MAQPRYQIFVSSTFKDLQEERQAVLNAILKLNQFPAGMEIFPAVNDTAWEHIEKVIEDSDYYVLIIGGKYGSIETESGISYTEKEYDFAVSKNIPVLAFTRSDEDSIPVGKAEMNEEVREKLKKFKQKVGNRHHWNYWKTLEELKANVVTSLAMAFVMNPQKGWIKAGGIDNIELLSRLAELQKKHDSLLEENRTLKEFENSFDFSQFEFGKNEVELGFGYRRKPPIWYCKLKWIDLFLIVGKKILRGDSDEHIRSSILKLAVDHYKKTLDFIELEKESKDAFPKVVHLHLPDISLDKVRNQFLALQLINVTNSKFEKIKPFNEGTYSSISQIWDLTDKGKKIYLNETAIKNQE